MDIQAKYQDKILKFLPKAASAVNLPFSPNKEKRFSGAIVPMIPHEARLRRRPKDSGSEDDGIDGQEPTSPKISCMGQIKLKNKKTVIKKNKSFDGKNKRVVTWSPRDAKKQASALKRMFTFNKRGRKSSASDSSSPSGGDHHHRSLPDRAPSLSQMKRFASGRDHRMASFDWTAVQVAPVDAEHRNIDDEYYEDDDVIIPFSAPLVINGGDNGKNINEVPLQPRKEINLWKRRTMTPPRPLDLNTMMIRAN